MTEPIGFVIIKVEISPDTPNSFDVVSKNKKGELKMKKKMLRLVSILMVAIAALVCVGGCHGGGHGGHGGGGHHGR